MVSNLFLGKQGSTEEDNFGWVDKQEMRLSPSLPSP